MRGARMEFKFPYSRKNDFVEINSFGRLAVLSMIFAFTFALTFFVIPFETWRLHFFQLGIFTASFVFGPWVGALVGALSSSYNGLFVINNPWIIGGNALLGFLAGYLYKRFGAEKAVLAAFAVQLPYLWITDVYLVHMPVAAVIGITCTLLVTNMISVLIAARLSPLISKSI